MQMTVCGNVPLFQTDDDSEGMYFSTEQALSQHKAFIIEAKRGNSADTAPFLLVSGKGKALYNHQVSGCSCPSSRSSTNLIRQTSSHFHFLFTFISIYLFPGTSAWPDISQKISSAFCVLTIQSTIYGIISQVLLCFFLCLN